MNKYIKTLIHYEIAIERNSNSNLETIYQVKTNLIHPVHYKLTWIKVNALPYIEPSIVVVPSSVSKAMAAQIVPFVNILILPKHSCITKE